MHCTLINIDNKLSLQCVDGRERSIFCVDFLSKKLLHRQKFGGGKNQLIAKAVGIKPREKCFVLDATAGLGEDAFVLASLGCCVLMLERAEIIFKLLQDAFLRAKKETWFGDLSFDVLHQDAILYLQTSEYQPDVIYLDPMFPEKNKSARSNIKMRALHELVGEDIDAEKLLSLAMACAKKRVVVKRPRLAPALSDVKPDIVFTGKSCRYDVYVASKKVP